jgi:hypothetical protein
VKNKLPKSLAEKAAGFPECSYGACKARLVLASGAIVDNVLLAWGCEVIGIGKEKYGSHDMLPFKIDDVIDVKPMN